MRGRRRQIVGIVVHVVAGSTLVRAAMAAAVMGDDAEATVRFEPLEHFAAGRVSQRRQWAISSQTDSRDPFKHIPFGGKLLPKMTE